MTTIPHQSLYESLLSLYSQNIEADERTSILDVPIGNYGTLGLLPPHPIFWVQLTIVLIIQSTLNSIAAVIIYVSIVQHRGSTRSYLVGYGIICPLLIVVPFHMFRILGLHNMVRYVNSWSACMVRKGRGENPAKRLLLTHNDRMIALNKYYIKGNASWTISKHDDCFISLLNGYVRWQKMNPPPPPHKKNN